jgi:DNA helicase-2/ATP-dependent DNA helicase PcrA
MDAAPDGVAEPRQGIDGSSDLPDSPLPTPRAPRPGPEGPEGSGRLVPKDADPPGWVMPPDPVVPGERRYRDGQKVRHRVFGEGHVVSSKLTRSDEEVTVAFPGQGVKKLMASLAGLKVPR